MKHHFESIKDFLDEIEFPEEFLTKFTEQEKLELEKEVELSHAFFEDYSKYELNEEITTQIWNGTLKCNFNALGIFLDSFYKYYQKILGLVEDFIKANPNKYRSILRKIIYYQAMVKNIYYFIYSAMISDPNEIYYVDEESEEWKAFCNNVHELNLYEDDPEKAIKNYCNLCSWMITAEATMSAHEVDEKSTFKRLLKSGTNALKFFYNKSSRMKQYMTSLAHPDLDMVKTLWNVFDTEYVIGAIEKRLFSVETNNIIYVPR